MSGVPNRLRAGDDVVFRELAGEAVLLDLKSGLYYGLDEVGTRFWTLATDSTVEDAIGALSSEYDVDEARLRADIGGLVSELLSRKLVTAVD